MAFALHTRGLSQKQKKRAWWQFALNISGFIAVLVIFSTQLDSLSGSIAALRRADGVSLVLALLAVIATYPVAALSYTALSEDQNVPLRSTIYIQIASGFVNRILPIGLGNLGLYSAYYHKLGFTIPAATALVATNNILGVIGSLMLAVVILITQPHYIGSLRAPRLSTGLYVLMGCVAVAALVSLLVGRRHRSSKAVTSVVSTLQALRAGLHVNHRTLRSLFYNLSLTSIYAFVLSTSVTAVGGNLPWPAALLVLSLGTLVGVLLPTPGGIGGVEAGLLAGMLAFGVVAGPALAAVLLYRALSYWLPIIPGFLMFRYISGRYV